MKPKRLGVRSRSGYALPEANPQPLILIDAEALIIVAAGHLEAERVRDLCTDLLEQLSRESPLQAALIDAVGHGLRGNELANAIGLSTTELATARRALKRHVQRLWPAVEQRIDQIHKD